MTEWVLTISLNFSIINFHLYNLSYAFFSGFAAYYSKRELKELFKEYLYILFEDAFCDESMCTSHSNDVFKCSRT